MQCCTCDKGPERWLPAAVWVVQAQVMLRAREHALNGSEEHSRSFDHLVEASVTPRERFGSGSIHRQMQISDADHHTFAILPNRSDAAKMVSVKDVAVASQHCG